MLSEPFELPGESDKNRFESHLLGCLGHKRDNWNSDICDSNAMSPGGMGIHLIRVHYGILFHQNSNDIIKKENEHMEFRSNPF